MSLDLAPVKTVCRQAIDSRAPDAEEDVWSGVALKVHAVLDASDGAAVARIISWWHNDWSARPLRKARLAW